MFVFGKPHDWQGDPAVKQILVFPNQEMAEVFDKDFAIEVEKRGELTACDSNLGAVYKLRAVKTGTGQWQSVILCGISGTLLWQGNTEWVSPDYALKVAYLKLGVIISDSMSGRDLKFFD